MIPAGVENTQGIITAQFLKDAYSGRATGTICGYQVESVRRHHLK
jgi:hypothetical protein